MDECFDARLFGAGVPATGEDARLCVAAHQIEVRSARGTQRVALDALRVREVVSAHAGLEFAWDTRSGPCAVQMFDPAALRALHAHPALRHLAAMTRVRGGQRRAGAVRAFVFGLIALVVLLPLLLLGLFLWQADRIAGAMAERIPVAQEAALGRQVFNAMRGRLDLQSEGEAAESLRALGARLTQGSRFDYQFHVAQDPAINAFALPGGIIVMHTGLLEAAGRAEEIAGVLAHEIQHVEQRHSLRAVIKDLGLRGLWAMVTGDLGGTLAGQAAMELATLRFSRDAEREADALGFETLVRHDIDPSGMVEFFGTLAEESGPAPPAWASTHPPSEQRRQALQRRLEQLQGRDFPALSLKPDTEASAPW